MKVIPLSVALASLLAVAGASAAEFTQPGRQLAVGETAILPMRIPYGPQVPIQVTVTSIQEGTLADLAQYNVPENLKQSRPYYVRFKVTRVDGKPLEGNSLGYTVAVDDRNEVHTSTLPMGALQGVESPCKNTNGPIGSPSYEGCEMFMIHASGSLKGFVFQEFETPYQKTPVTWVPGAAPTTQPAQPTGMGKLIQSGG